MDPLTRRGGAPTASSSSASNAPRPVLTKGQMNLPKTRLSGSLVRFENLYPCEQLSRGNSDCAGVKQALRSNPLKPKVRLTTPDCPILFPNSRIIRYIKNRLHLSMFDDFSGSLDSDLLVEWISKGETFWRRIIRVIWLTTFLLAVCLFKYFPLCVFQYKHCMRAPWKVVEAHRNRNVGACQSRWERNPLLATLTHSPIEMLTQANIHIR